MSDTAEPGAQELRKVESERPVSGAVFDVILHRILDGRYPSGAKLPSEREWVVETSASRVSVRAALDRLSQWNIIEIRRGSGAVVSPMRAWSLDVLPSYVRKALRDGRIPALAQSLMEVLEIRRDLLVLLLGKLDGRLKVGDLDPARLVLQAAWDARADPRRFVVLDVEVFREMLVCADRMTSLWVFNGFVNVYLRAAKELPEEVIVSQHYFEVYEEMFSHLENGRMEDAKRVYTDYLAKHDALMASRALGFYPKQ